jgi:hypothetical protein
LNAIQQILEGFILSFIVLVFFVVGGRCGPIHFHNSLCATRIGVMSYVSFLFTCSCRCIMRVRNQAKRTSNSLQTHELQYKMYDTRTSGSYVTVFFVFFFLRFTPGCLHVWNCRCGVRFLSAAQFFPILSGCYQCQRGIQHRLPLQGRF